jgi:hypothetical protein
MTAARVVLAVHAPNRWISPARRRRKRAMIRLLGAAIAGAVFMPAGAQSPGVEA